MNRRPDTVLDPAKIDLLRKALMVAPMTLDLTGMSMFPAIRLGDRCRVQSVPLESLRVGDVILTTRDSRLIAHRITRIEDGPVRLWHTRGDTLLAEDPPSRDEDILGQVVAIVRRGKTVNLLSRTARLAGRVQAGGAGVWSWVFAWAIILRRRALAATARFAGIRFRRRHASQLTVRPATLDDVEALAFLMGDQEAARRPTHGLDLEHLRAMARRMLEGNQAVGSVVWIAEDGPFIVGQAIIGPLADGPNVPGWWVMSVYVKMTARGRGAAEALVRAGIEDARAEGVSELRYAAHHHNTASINLAAKLGFEPDPSSDAARRFVAYYRYLAPRGEGPRVFRLPLTPGDT